VRKDSSGIDAMRAATFVDARYHVSSDAMFCRAPLPLRFVAVRRAQALYDRRRFTIDMMRALSRLRYRRALSRLPPFYRHIA